MLASSANMQRAKSQVINAKANTVRMLVEQYNITTEAVEQNIQSFLYGKRMYPALGLDRQETIYQQSLIWLKDDLTDVFSYYPQLAGMYTYVPHTGDFFCIRNEKWLAFENYEHIRETLDGGGSFLNTTLFDGGNRTYVVKSLTNTYMEIGYIISGDFLKAQLTDSLNDGDRVRLLAGGRTLDMVLDGSEAFEPHENDYTILEAAFSPLDAGLQLWVPSLSTDRMLSARDRSLWYISFALIFLLPIFLLILRKIFLVPMNKLSLAMGEILSGNTSYRIQDYSGTREFHEIEQAFNQTLDYNEALKIQAYEYKLQKEEQQLTNLKLQINPHLLLNSLNTIYSLSENNKNQEIKEFSMNLAKYFRYSLRDTEEYVTLQSEIDFIKSYNKIQRIRYPDAFYIMFDIDEALMSERIPPLVIQNFVENSTKYALIPGKEIEILVIVRRREDFLDISICDNGKGMAPEILEQLNGGEIVEDSRGRHIGVWNCIRRLNSLYGTDCQINITSKIGEGTQVWIHIPCNQIGEALTGGKHESSDR